MKIAVVTWLINDVGGINSWTENFIEGAKQLGHTLELFYSTSQNRLNCDEHAKICRGRFDLLPAKHLSYRDKFLSDSLKTLQPFDSIVFAHPSPHPTKQHTGFAEERNWQKLYTDTKQRKLAVFHDRHWNRTNSWFAEVRDHVDYAHAAQHHFIDAVAEYCRGKIPYDWGMFPLKMIGNNFQKKRRIVWPTQWLSIKNHRYLVPDLYKIRIPVDAYGGGQTYHTLLEEIKKVFRDDYHGGIKKTYNPNSIHTYYGHVEYTKLLSALKEAWFSLDLSCQGMTNMTHWEPLTTGTVSVLENRVLLDKYCEIPQDCCLALNLDNVAEELDRISKTPMTQLKTITERAWKYVQKCDSKRVVKEILSKAF